MLEESNDSLNAEQRHVFMDVITESLRITQRTHLFNWLQGELQFLLPHEVMIFGIKTADNESFHYEYFTSARYFKEEQFTFVIEQDRGLLNTIIKNWREDNLPVFVTEGKSPNPHEHYNVLQLDEATLKKSELKNFVVHGFVDNQNRVSSVVVFARLQANPSINLGHTVELLVPHLHCALIRVTSTKSNIVLDAMTVSNMMTRRESEILQWLHMGKTNWEISSILNISQLTVKNHVQNILRKLNVQNRSQAAVKATKLGLIKILK